MAQLESPEMLAIERRGTTMMMASSRAPQSTVKADGRQRQEKLSNGGSMTTTATLRGDQLVLHSAGSTKDGVFDSNVAFDSIEDGRRLRVRRQWHSAPWENELWHQAPWDNHEDGFVVNSVYDRTSDAAQWNIYNGSRPTLGNTGATSGEFTTDINRETVVDCAIEPTNDFKTGEEHLFDTSYDSLNDSVAMVGQTFALSNGNLFIVRLDEHWVATAVQVQGHFNKRAERKRF